MAAISREQLIRDVRTLTRQTNTKPFTDADILRFIEFGIDDLSNRVPFAMALDRTHSERGISEYILPIDVLEVIELYYRNASAVVLATSINTTANEIEVRSLTTEFPNSGVLIINDEQVRYTSKTDYVFKNVTRGVNNTIAASHTSGAIVEEVASWQLLEPISSRDLAIANPLWLSSNPGVPTYYYSYGGVIGFDRPLPKTGKDNIMIRSLIRPPALGDDKATIAGLFASATKAIIHYAAAELALTLAQDDASVIQARQWQQMYLAEVQQFATRQSLYQRGRDIKMKPRTGRL